jgi:hypothetical protein
MENKVHLDSFAEITDASASFIPEQYQSIDCSRPQSPPLPPSPSPNPENPNLGEFAETNPAIFVADNGQGVPQHPENPQDHLDLELSGSSMRFLRGEGPEISLDQVIDNIIDNDSSSSSDATSELIEERARFEAARTCCVNVLIFGRKGLPGDVFVRATGPAIGRSVSALGSRIVIPASTLQMPIAQSSTAASIGLEIVPWKPVRDVIALQLWPHIVECRRTPKVIAEPAPVIIRPEDEQADQAEGASPDSGPTSFEFQTQQAQPISTLAPGQKRGRGRPRKVLSLPAPSKNSAPIVESSVRRSSRVSKGKNGFHTPTVMLEEEPSKKRNKIGAVLIDESTGMIGPVPMAILQDWGVKCGIAPEELSQEALMQAPSTNQAPNEQHDA